MNPKERLEDCQGHTVYRVEADRIVVERAPAEGPVIGVSDGELLRGKPLVKGDVIGGLPPGASHAFAPPYWVDIE